MREEIDAWGLAQDEDDELDPLAPASFSGAPGLREDDVVDPLAPVVFGDAPEPEEDASDGGVTDPDGIVRVWVVGGRIQKVRVSPQWYRKLGKRPLGECVSYALRLANIRVARVEDTPARDFTDEDFSALPEFSTVAFAAFQGVVADVHERWAAARLRHGRRPAPQHQPTLGRSEGVTVGLNGAGLADTVTIDEKWLDVAQAGQIGDHVQKAAAAAYARFVPPPSERGELEEIEAEHAYVMAAFKAMLNPKEPR